MFGVWVFLVSCNLLLMIVRRRELRWDSRSLLRVCLRAALVVDTVFERQQQIILILGYVESSASDKENGWRSPPLGPVEKSERGSYDAMAVLHVKAFHITDQDSQPPEDELWSLSGVTTLLRRFAYHLHTSCFWLSIPHHRHPSTFWTVLLPRKMARKKTKPKRSFKNTPGPLSLDAIRKVIDSSSLAQYLERMKRLQREPLVDTDSDKYVVTDRLLGKEPKLLGRFLKGHESEAAAVFERSVVCLNDDSERLRKVSAPLTSS